MKWKLGPYFSNANLEDYAFMLQRLCVLPGHYVLTCFNAAKPEGWHNSYLHIQGQRYCDDFTAYKAFRNIVIHGMWKFNIYTVRNITAINFHHIFIKSFIIHSLELGETCKCNEFVDANGYGNCLKEINGTKVCYINQPSSCNDLKYSNSIPEKKISAEACSGNSVCKSYDQW